MFDDNIKRAENLAWKFDTGMYYINEPVRSKNELPWGGIKNSGFGRDNGYEGFEYFALLKTIVKPKTK